MLHPAVGFVILFLSGLELVVTSCGQASRPAARLRGMRFISGSMDGTSKEFGKQLRRLGFLAAAMIAIVMILDPSMGLWPWIRH